MKKGNAYMLLNRVVLSNALAGRSFDLSTDEGLMEAVSNIVTILGGNVGPIGQ